MASYTTPQSAGAAGEDENGTKNSAEWLLVDEVEACSISAFDSCRQLVLRCADLLSLRLSDEEHLASQLAMLAKLHVQLQQLADRASECLVPGPNGYWQLAQLAEAVATALCKELEAEAAALTASLGRQLQCISNVISLALELAADAAGSDQLLASTDASARITELGQAVYDSNEWHSFFEEGTQGVFGLHLDPSLRNALWLIVLATSEIKSNDPSLPAPSLLVGGLRIARSLICGHSIEAISSSRAPQRVEVRPPSFSCYTIFTLLRQQALKAFWDLPESIVVGSLPKIVLPSVAVDSLFEIPSTSVQINLCNTGEVFASGRCSFRDAASVGTRCHFRIAAIHHPSCAGGLETILGAACARRCDKLLTIVVAHGWSGGFVAQSSFSHEVYLRIWAAEMPDTVILSVDYPTAPEALFPTALESVMTAYRWALANQSQIGWGGDAVVLVGDSAGANLVAAACVELAADSESAERMPGGLVLVYPALYLGRRLSASRLLSMWDPMLPKNMLEACVDAYLPHNADADVNPSISPLMAPADVLRRMPWTHCIAAGCDPLLDDAVAFVHRVCESGGRAQLQVKASLSAAYGVMQIVVQVMDRLCHGFLHFGLVSESCKEAVVQTARQLHLMLVESARVYSQELEATALRMLHAELQHRLDKKSLNVG